MSWSFTKTATSRAAAKAAVAADLSVVAYKYCPETIVTAINAAIDAAAEPDDGRVIVVSSSGHISTPPRGDPFDNFRIDIQYGPA